MVNESYLPFPAKVRIQLVRETPDYPSPQITGPDDVRTVLQGYFQAQDREHLVCLHLSSSNKILGIEVVSIGSLNASIVHPREVLKSAVLSNAASIILAHNHPSGELKPSKEDLAVTERIKQACQIMDIKLLDHIIFGHHGIYSIMHHS